MLPQPQTEAEFDALNRRGTEFTHAVREAFAERIGTMRIEATALGSHPVFFVGDHYVAKLFSPLHKELVQTEVAALQLLQGNPDIPTPDLLDVAKVEGWSAVLMTRLRGESLKNLWPSLALERKERVCTAIGTIARALHESDPSTCKASSLDWKSFHEMQIRECASRQRRLGLDESLARPIPEFLESVTIKKNSHVLLHTEIMLDHIFADQLDDDLQVTGLIDFEPAMVGLPEYEFASIGLFVTQGNSRLLRAFMSGYGQAADEELHRRIMYFALLHRYRKLSWYLKFMPGADTLEDLAKKWFGPIEYLRSMSVKDDSPNRSACRDGRQLGKRRQIRASYQRDLGGTADGQEI